MFILKQVVRTTMAKSAFSVLVPFLLFVCVWTEKSNVEKVHLASFTWKEEDNKNCSAVELETSNLSVMHIEGRCSPFRLPNLTWWRAISDSIKGDTQRCRAMMKRRSSAGKSMVNPQEDADLPLAINMGSYIIKLGFGTPAQSFYTVIDTGSDIAWIPCNPCSSCSSKLQLFEPSKSRTYKYFTCASQQCQSLGACENNNNCSFTQGYADGSKVLELLSSETLSVGSQPMEDFVFGCANAVSGIIQRTSTPGLVGFGKDPLSFVSQTAKLYDKTFSYCLPSLFSSDSMGSLMLGKGALSASRFQFTPLLSDPSIYYVGLSGISVGEEFVSITAGDQSTGTIIIDSGTVITRLVEAAYDAMRDSFRRQLSNQTLASPMDPFDTCYNIPSGEVEVPLITLHFDDNLDLTLPVKNSLYVNEEGSVFCLAFAPPPPQIADLSIFGSYQQQNFRIVYDVAGSRLGIASENCNGK